MLHQNNFPSKVADWRSERHDEKNRAVMMKDDNVEVLSIGIDREFYGAQDLLKEHKFVAGVFVAPGDDEMANLYIRQLQNVISLNVNPQVWKSILTAIVRVQREQGVEVVSPLAYLAQKPKAQKRRQKKRHLEKLQMMGGTPEDEDIPAAFAPDDVNSDNDIMDFDFAPPLRSTFAPPPPPPLPGEGHPAPVHLPTMERQYDFSSVIGVRIAENGQHGSVLGGRMDENVGPVIKIRNDLGDQESEVAWNDLGRLMKNAGDLSDELIHEKVAACTRSLFTPPRMGVGLPFGRLPRRGGA